VLDLLVDLVQLAEDLLGELLDGFPFPSSSHAQSEEEEFNKLCGETVR
jgi:hypothetical protein